LALKVAVAGKVSSVTVRSTPKIGACRCTGPGPRQVKDIGLGFRKWAGSGVTLGGDGKGRREYRDGLGNQVSRPGRIRHGEDAKGLRTHLGLAERPFGHTFGFGCSTLCVSPLLAHTQAQGIHTPGLFLSIKGP